MHIKNILALTMCALSFTTYAGAEQEQVAALKPDGGMPMWYYRTARSFKHPIPTEFDFAYIDRSGKEVITGPFKLARDFNDNVAVVEMPPLKSIGGLLYPDVDSDQSISAILDPAGVATPLAPARVKSQFSSGFAVAEFPTEIKNSKHLQLRYDLTDKAGKRKSSGNWQEANAISDGLIAVKAINSAKNGSPLWGYRDAFDKLTIPEVYYEAGPFSEGLAAVCIERPTNDVLPPDLKFYHPNKYSYIDKNGKVAVPGPFMEAEPFKNGLAAVMVDGKWGYINKLGKVVIDFQYDWAGKFSGKLAPVEKGGLVGFIDNKNKAVIPFKFADAREFSSELAPATLDGKRWGYISIDGNFTLEPTYLRCYPFASERALVLVKPKTAESLSPQKYHQFYLREVATARDSGKIDEAKKLCHTIIENAPKSISAARAKKLLAVGIPDYEYKPEILAQYKEGTRLLTSGNLDGGIDLLKKVAKEDPTFYPAVGAMCYGYLVTRRFPEGIEAMKASLAVNPSYARGHWRLGQLYKEAGQKAQAEKCFTRGKALDDSDSEYMQ